MYSHYVTVQPIEEELTVKFFTVNVEDELLNNVSILKIRIGLSHTV